MIRVIFLSVLALAIGCGSGDPEAAPVAPAVQTDDPLAAWATTPDGRRIQLEVAANDNARARGLMFRERLADDRGMLFLFRDDDRHSFWMKNTLIPLDMVWLDASGTIVHIERGVPPCPGDPCPSVGPELDSRNVLELSSGGAARYDLEPGDRLAFEGLESYTIE